MGFTKLFGLCSFIILFFISFSIQDDPIPIGILRLESLSAFQQLIVDGAQKFVDESNGKYYLIYEDYTHTPVSEAIDKLVKKSDYIVTYGFEMVNGVTASSEIYDDKRFLIVDVGLDLKNVVGIVFAEDQAGFLTGLIAGSLTKTKITACIGGVPIAPTKSFCNSFHEAVLLLCPDCEFLLDYAPTWTSFDWGVETGKRFVQQGADMIFGAGGEPGTYGILKAAEYEGVYVFGVDQDEYITSFNGTNQSNKILTSAIKKADVGTYFGLNEIVQPDFEQGIKLLDIGDGGVGVAPCHETCHLWTDEVNSTFVTFYEDLVTGRQSTGVTSKGDKIGVSTTERLVFFPIRPTGFRPRPRTEASLTVFTQNKNQFVLMYGADYSYTQPDFYKYDWESSGVLEKPNNWSTIISKNLTVPSKRSKHSALQYDEKWMVVFGGQFGGSQMTNELWFYDVEFEEWIQKGPFIDPPARHSHIAEIIDNKMYIYGGMSETLSVLDDVWSFDLELEVWRKEEPKGDKPQFLRSACSTVERDSIWIFGGSSGKEQLNSLVRYNTTTNVWSNIKYSSDQVPSPRESCVIIFLSNQIYMYGGFSSSELSDVWIYDKFLQSWREIPMQNNPAPSMSGHSVAVVYDSYVEGPRFLFFGNSDSKGDSFYSLLPENPPTTKVIDCNGEQKITIVGNFEDNWDYEIIRDVYWCDGYYDCENRYDEPTEECSPSITIVIIFFGVLSGISILCFIGLSIWLKFNEKKPIVKSATPPFLHLMLIGASILVSIVYFSIPQPNDAICAFIPWYLVLGFHLMYGSLLVKNWRLSFIFNNKKMEVVSYSNAKLSLKLLFWAVPDIVILVIGYGIETPSSKLEDQTYDESEDKEHWNCTFNQTYLLVLALYQALLVLYGVRLAYKTRNLNSRFNESKYVALSIYTFFIIGVFIIPIVFLVEQPIPKLIVVFLALHILVDTTIALTFIPKMIGIDSSSSHTNSTTAYTTSPLQDLQDLEQIPEISSAISKLSEDKLNNYFQDMGTQFPTLISKTKAWIDQHQN